jgi:MFS family permease
MMFWTMEATGSASLMGALMMMGTLPTVLLGPLAGTLADRVSRKWILVFCDAGSGLVLLGLAVPFFLPDIAQPILISCLVGMTLLVGILQAFFLPASTALLPDLVPKEKLAAANGLDQGSLQLSTLIGQSVGGILYKVLGAPVLFVVDGVSYLFSAVSESFIRVRPAAEPGPSDAAGRGAYTKEMMEGLRYVWDHRGMRDFLLLAAVVNFLAMPIIVLLPFLVTDNLDRGAEWYGFLLAGFGGGALVGYALAGGIALAARHRAAVLLSTLIIESCLLGGLGFVRLPWLALAMMIGTGALGGFFNIILTTAFQTGADESLRGRVMGVVMTVAMGIAPLGMALGGILGDLTDKNLPLIFGLCGSLIVLATLLLGLRRPVREFLAFSTATGE